ncbi:hypothetical protein H4P35_18735 [Achromobacter sp. 77]|uniref:hypothetical protein n=1 Tax=Achromobacter sp. 77 TaxID=2756133 RepID=UPI001D008809|nr:hypothetical protein [Achromobacter sp. 77]UDG74253.1 hypothetical protein H4P35_18735 [Achromobacter sp. 77]
MSAPQNLDDLDDVDLAALSTRVLHDMVAKMAPEERQRYREALDAADAPLRSFLGAALGTPETSTSAPGKNCTICRGAFSGMSWDTLCPSCWEEDLRNDSADRRGRALAAGRAPTAAVRDVIAERQRQITAEGWTPGHDDLYHETGQLESAAGCYAMFTLAYPPGDPVSFCPWSPSLWKPSADPRRNLIKAAALLLAEIERLDRAALAAQVPQQGEA